MIHRLGPISFAEFMDLALYDPQSGFFATGGGAGRGGDFLTSPEVGQLFGAVVAGALDTWWEELGRPEPYVVVEAGGGAGTLAAAVRAAAPVCAPALHYVMVERSELLRARHALAVPVEPPSEGLGMADEDDHGDLSSFPARTPTPRGPTFTSLADLPASPFTGVVMANELLDNLPFRLLEQGDGWEEVRVADVGGRLVEVLVPAPPELTAEADRVAPASPAGARIPMQLAAQSWLRQALSLVEEGRVVVIDYASTTPCLAARPSTEWIRTYRAHGRGTGPLEDAGVQDITCEVALDQLNRVRMSTLDRTQAEFLSTHGIQDLVAGARKTWNERAHLGDLQALRARSRVGEAGALTDLNGLGGFRVLEWFLGR